MFLQKRNLVCFRDFGLFLLAQKFRIKTDLKFAEKSEA